MRLASHTPRNIRPRANSGAVRLFYLLAAIVALSVFTMGQTPGERESVFDKPLQLHRGPAGPYEVIITIQPHKPRVGTVHFGVTILDPAAQELVENARVLIVAYNPEGEPTFQTPALNDPATPIHYKGNIIFRSAGQWSLLTKIETDEHGEVTTTTPLNIAEAATVPSFEGRLILALVTLALGGGTAWVVFSIRRVQRARDAEHG
ncbi:MAG: hypothetical protein F4X57_02885 [Chloroflexi bacterium]|nr:hypothetical protein [Chloroflexota bacterium]